MGRGEGRSISVHTCVICIAALKCSKKLKIRPCLALQYNKNLFSRLITFKFRANDTFIEEKLNIFSFMLNMTIIFIISRKKYCSIERGWGGEGDSKFCLIIYSPKIICVSKLFFHVN